MAHTVKEMPKPQRASRYPWAEWLNGEIWVLEPGVDFECSVASMRQQVYQAAANTQRSARTREHDGMLYIEVRERT